MRGSRLAALGGALTAGLAAAVLTATPASAHVEVAADKAQAGARDVTLTFTGEAESVTAGIVSERVVLPSGMDPAGVRLGKAPKGWKLVPGADGFTVTGTPLKVKQDAVFSVIVDQLPADQRELAFKTLETYTDGKVSRWIELPGANGEEPENPAPILKVKAAAPTTPPAPPSAAASTAVSSAPATVIEAEPAAEDGDSSVVSWILAGGIVVILAAVGVFVARQRRTR